MSADNCRNVDADELMAEALGVPVAELDRLRAEHRQAHERRERDGFVPCGGKRFVPCGGKR